MMFDHNSSEGAIEEEDLAWRRAARVLVFVLGLGLMFALIAALFGCGGRVKDAEDAYRAEQRACIAAHVGDHAARVACINDVRARWAAEGKP
jgi:hypothetical protein